MGLYLGLFGFGRYLIGIDGIKGPQDFRAHSWGAHFGPLIELMRYGGWSWYSLHRRRLC